MQSIAAQQPQGICHDLIGSEAWPAKRLGPSSPVAAVHDACPNFGKAICITLFLCLSIAFLIRCPLAMRWLVSRAELGRSAFCQPSAKGEAAFIWLTHLAPFPISSPCLSSAVKELCHCSNSIPVLPSQSLLQRCRALRRWHSLGQHAQIAAQRWLRRPSVESQRSGGS